MSYTIDTNEFRLLRDYVEKHCGIHLDDSKVYLIENRLASLRIEYGCKTFSDIYYKAIADSTNTLRDRIIDAMTTNETLWFRDSSPFITFEKVLLPLFAQMISRGQKSRIRIWSAACSSGQEPYSLAMIIQDFFKNHGILRPEQVEITATDISPTMLQHAKAGQYDSLVISRGLPDEKRNRFFDQHGKMWVLRDSIKKMVTFKKLNLQEDFSSLGPMDIVFCRNVLIYFSDVFKTAVLTRLAAQLRPSGYLFVGASESVSNYCTDFTMQKFEKSLYYQVK